MTITRSAFGAGLVVSLVLSSAVVMAAEVDGGRIIAADKEPQNWLSHGRTYGEQRFSPLAKITTANVGQLGLAWSHDIASRTARGVEATPIVVDGVMYTTGAWSHVLALDARTGKLLWEFDPQISGAYGAKGCCDVVNRGVAVWAGKVYVGAFDGRLIALDAKTGKKVWETLTVDQSQDYTISGAPRVVKGKVIIGNGGADFGVRGYVSAYDAETGTMAWRFYTVPGNPKDGFEWRDAAAAPHRQAAAQPAGADRVEGSAGAGRGVVSQLLHEVPRPRDGGRWCRDRSAVLGHARLPEAYRAVVLDGVLMRNGMISFSDFLKPDDVEAIRAYVIEQAHREQKRLSQ